jgi:hypothetical protein
MRNRLSIDRNGGVLAAWLIAFSGGGAEEQISPSTPAAGFWGNRGGGVEDSSWYDCAGGRGAGRQISDAVPTADPEATDHRVRQVQREDGQPPAPTTQPPPTGGAASIPTAIQPGEPGSNTSDFSLPAAERAFGGGEPTTSAAEAEEAAAEQDMKDARGLLMKALDVSQDSDWKIYGWIQNSFTGNANAYGNGFNFGVNPNFKANQWMGNQYYLIFEKPLKQDDEINFGFRVDNLYRKRLAIQLYAGSLQSCVPSRLLPGVRPGPDLRRGPPAFPHEGGAGHQGRAMVHDRWL